MSQYPVLRFSSPQLGLRPCCGSYINELMLRLAEIFEKLYLPMVNVQCFDSHSPRTFSPGHFSSDISPGNYPRIYPDIITRTLFPGHNPSDIIPGHNHTDIIPRTQSLGHYSRTQSLGHYSRTQSLGHYSRA